MTRFVPLWQQEGEYAATADRRLLTALWPTARVNGLAVSPSGSGLIVNIAAGDAAIPAPNGTGTVLCSSNAVEQVQLNTAGGAGQHRYDTLIAEVHGPDVGGGGTQPDWVIRAISSATSGSPTPPVVPAGAVGLANVYVAGNALAIAAANITDIRPPPLAVSMGIHCRVHRQAAWTIAAGGAPGTQCQMDTVDDDPNGLLQANGNLVLPVAGRWDIRAQLQATIPATAIAFCNRILVNGNVVTACWSHGSVNFGINSFTTHTYRAARGDVIGAYGAASTGSLAGGAGSVFASWMTADYLGP